MARYSSSDSIDYFGVKSDQSLSVVRYVAQYINQNTRLTLFSTTCIVSPNFDYYFTVFMRFMMCFSNFQTPFHLQNRGMNILGFNTNTRITDSQTTLTWQNIHQHLIIAYGA